MRINNKIIKEDNPTYFIADIAANHDGSLQKAIDLMGSAKEAGADAAKFQHFRAEYIVSDQGFKELGSKQSHQASWGKSVFEVYKEASLPWEWTEELAKQAKNIGIDFFTSPYDLEAVDHVDEYVSAYKIGSGDITWHKIIKHIATKNKPVIMATGASCLEEVRNAASILEKGKNDYSIMQCNTNYTGSKSNLRYINLNVLKTYKELFPRAILGLSDHTEGDITVLGAISMGARLIEKHFTDDNTKNGPDHSFSMNPETWRTMVDRTRDLELALGTGEKKVEENEMETVIIQRRGIRFQRSMKIGELIEEKDLIALRPAPQGCITPDRIGSVIGKELKMNVKADDIVYSELLK